MLSLEILKVKFFTLLPFIAKPGGVIHGKKGFVILTKSFVKTGIAETFCYNNKVFSPINKTFGCCSKFFNCNNKNFICCPYNFVAVPKPFFPCKERGTSS